MHIIQGVPKLVYKTSPVDCKLKGKNFNKQFKNVFADGINVL